MSTHMPLDEVLMVIALGAYVVGALALLVYFFSREEWLVHLGAPLAIAGVIAQVAQLIVRFESTGVWPLLNLYGSLSFFALMGVTIFIIFAFRYKLWFIGGFVLAIAAIAVAYAVTWNEGTLPAVPSLQSYWAKIHVPLVVTSYGAFLVSFVLSGVYLVKYYVERAFAGSARAGSDGEIAVSNTVAAGWLASLPSLAQLDMLIYRVVAVGLPLLTLGILTGAMWAHEAWGAYWQWDPKETAALFSWIIYLSYMHLHTRNNWRGLKTSWISVIGFISIIFCYLGVNIWISGLHSYKM